MTGPGSVQGPVVFRNGALFDGERYRGAVGAVIVERGLVTAVLPPGERPAPGACTEIDLAGGLLAPGFVDAHVHAVQGGLERIRCDLSAASDRNEYLAVIARYAADQRDDEWIVGGGWSQPAFPGGTPTAADLDRVVGDRPAFLPNRDHHGAWVSSRALLMAGIDATTPDPPHGRIERDARGEPTGTLHESAMALVAGLLPPTSESEYDQALRAGQAYLHSVGVVGWQDAIVGSYAGMDDPGPAYRRAAERGELNADVVGALWWEPDAGLEQLESLVARREAYGAGRFRATSVKIMQDGVPENLSAAMWEPYLDPDGRPGAIRGQSFVDPDRLAAAVAALVAAGFQVHVHAIGDRALTETLDAFAHAAAAGLDVRAGRHHIAHLQVVRSADLPRFAELGVAANLQALWACFDEQMIDLVLPVLGPQRSRRQYPFGSLQSHGARLVMGSDWPVTSPDPLAAIHVAVNRTMYGETGPAGRSAFLPAQALGLSDAFGAYTAGSAWVNHRDDAGVIAPGRAADLVVLDRDPFCGPAAEIGSTTVTSTWVAGAPVHERSG